MTLRCGCYREGDATVFGEPHECSVTPKPPADLPRFIPSWRFVVPETSEGTAAADIQVELNRLEGIQVPESPPESSGLYDPELQEARIHQVLGEDELHD